MFARGNEAHGNPPRPKVMEIVPILMKVRGQQLKWYEHILLRSENPLHIMLVLKGRHQGSDNEEK